MLTWSSWLAEVGRLSTLAGCASDLFSEASAAAVTCAIMKPELSPPCRRGMAAAALRLASISSAMRRSESAPISAIASARLSAAKATGSAWKLPPESTSPSSREDQRIVGDAVRLDAAACARRPAPARGRRPSTCGWQRSEYGSCTRVAVRGASARMSLPAEHGAECGGDRRSARLAAQPRGCAHRTACRCPSPRRPTSRRRRSPRRTRLPPRTAPASASAVETCVPLSSARPSFGPKLERLDAGGLERLRGAPASSPCTRTRALADQRRATGARAARGRRKRRPSPSTGCSG